MSGPELLTFGCRLNIAESEAMRALAPADDDLVIVNSCAVTAEAVRQSRQAIRRARRARPDARIVVTGCAAQIEPDRFAAMPEVDRVVGAAEKFRADSFRFGPERVAPEVRVGDIAALRQTAPNLVHAFTEHARAFVEIQTGCDHACTFCVIPQGRGRNRSLPAGLLVDRVRALVAAGHAEIVLTGVDIASYGADLPGASGLASLVVRLLRHVPELRRLRLSTLDPAAIDDRLLDLLTGEPRVMPHVHLSLQAGSDLILKRMRRRHLRGQAIDLVARLKSRRPEIAIGADLIAGFPTETDAQAGESLALLDDCDVVFAHIFPYSPRQGTPAARMPQVPREVIKTRAAALRAAGAARRDRWLRRQVGADASVLVERNGRTGHAENFATVALAGPVRSDRAGHILPVRIARVEGDHLIGTLA